MVRKWGRFRRYAQNCARSAPFVRRHPTLRPARDLMKSGAALPVGRIGEPRLAVRVAQLLGQKIHDQTHPFVVMHLGVASDP